MAREPGGTPARVPTGSPPTSPGGWGPYLWAPDCATGLANGTGYCYVVGDYQADQVHPAAGALEKITSMLHERFLREPWYRREATGAAGRR